MSVFFFESERDRPRGCTGVDITMVWVSREAGLGELGAAPSWKIRSVSLNVRMSCGMKRLSLSLIKPIVFINAPSLMSSK